MRIALFCHSLRSDWNHGNAHFLRGIVTALMARGHDVRAFEPANSWSAAGLVADAGPDALEGYRRVYPHLPVHVYDEPTLDLDRALEDVDLALVHEWNTPSLVAAVGRWRARHRDARVLFHDTHHRSITAPDEISAFDLTHYDGVLAFGECIRQEYLRRQWAARAWTWHEAADWGLTSALWKTRSEKNEFSTGRGLPPRGRPQGVRPRPVENSPSSHRVSHKAGVRPLVWIGNWGDGERAAEIDEYLLGPVRRMRIGADVYGVRYPREALDRLGAAGVTYRGWLPNYRVPQAFAGAKVTVHVPRRPYAEALPGIPTIRVFEALACGIPLVSAPWSDVERLFTPGLDYLVAHSGTEMEAHLRRVLNDPGAAATLAAHGLATVRARHTCDHRVDELLDIAAALGLSAASSAHDTGAGVPAGREVRA